MSADGQIDGLFRQGLGDHDPGPQMQLWPGIAKRLPKPFLSPRRIGLWAVLALGITAFLHSDQRAVMERAVDSTVQQTLAVGKRLVPASTDVKDSHALSDAQKYGSPSSQASLADYSGTSTETKPRKGKRSTRPLLGRPSQLSNLPEEQAVPDGLQNTLSSSSAAQESVAPDARPKLAETAFLEKRATPFTPYPVEDVIPPIRFLGERWFAGLDLSYSQDWMQRSLYPKAVDFEGYAQLRNTAEAFQSAHTAALRLSLISASGITLRGGIQVTRFSESFAHTTEQKELRFLPRRDASGNVIGTDTVFQVIRTNYNHLNRFKMVDIPLTIGYEFPWGKANFSLHAGPVFNMAFYQQGRFLAEDGERIVDFSSSTPDAYPAFRNRLSMGFYGSVNLSYPLTPSVHLFAEPYLRVFPGAFTNADYPLEQRYRVQGVFIGIRKVMGPYWMNLRP